jgi:hypothetical protein
VAILYVKSTGSATSPYDTWAKAHTSLESILPDAACVAGSTVYVDSAHNEQKAGAITLSAALGTALAPITVMTVDAAQPEGSEVYVKATAKTLQITAIANILYAGGPANYIGLHLETLDGNIVSAASGQLNWLDCTFNLNTAGSATRYFTITAQNLYWYLEGCTIIFNRSTTSALQIGGGGRTWFRNCTIGNSATKSAELISNLTPTGCHLTFDSCDLSNLAASANIVATAGVPTSTADGNNTIIRMSRCKLPTGFNFVQTAPTQRGWRFEAYNCDSGNTVFNTHIQDQYGTVVDSTAVYRDATYNKTAGYSLLMTPTARALRWEEPLRIKLSDLFVAANKTLTVQIVYDSATNLKNGQFWIEVVYPDSTIGAHGKLVSTKPANVLATASELSASSETWTGTGGFANENKDQISYTVSGGQAGVHTVWACLAPNATTPVVYVDPNVDIS